MSNAPWLPPFLYVLLFCAIVDFLKILVEIINRVEERRWTSDPSKVTAVIPSHNGASVLEKTIGSLTRILPPERILLVDDGSTDGTADLGRKLGCQVHRFERGKGKAGAINYAVYRVKTPYTLLLDDDTRLGDIELPTSLLDASADGDGFDAVAFHVLPDRRNREGAHGANFLGDIQRYEYGKSMEIGRRFHDVTKSVSCISGAVGLFRTKDLDDLHHAHTGVFQGEDLQRTLIHLLHGKEIVFVNQPVWTVAPWSWKGWFRQRLFGWYPAMYHNLFNFFRVLGRRTLPFRLKYEMLYNLYTVISDPLKVWSFAVMAITPGLRIWMLWIYLLYLMFELYPYLVVRVPGSRRRAPLPVLFLYPIYGAMNTTLRFSALFTWFRMRYVSKEMKPRRGEADRILDTPPGDHPSAPIGAAPNGKPANGKPVIGALPRPGHVKVGRATKKQGVGPLGPALLAIAALAWAAGAACAEPRVGAQMRYWSFSNGNDNRDVLVYVAPGQWHVGVEYWDFLRGRDQFRVEAGGYVKDEKGSSYSLLVREETFRRNVELQTEQIVRGGLVAKGVVRWIIPPDQRRLVVWGGGLDFYYDDYSMFSANVYRDPRAAGRVTAVISNRLGNERDYVQAGVAPASGRTIGYFVLGKYRWLVAGYERNNRYDFENLDNDIVTLGVELPLPSSGGGP